MTIFQAITPTFFSPLCGKHGVMVDYKLAFSLYVMYTEPPPQAYYEDT